MEIKVPSGEFRRHGPVIRRNAWVNIRRKSGISVRRDAWVSIRRGY